MELGLNGKVALVTGASAGLGFAAAMVLAEEGAKVAINSHSIENLERAAKKIKDRTVALLQNLDQGGNNVLLSITST